MSTSTVGYKDWMDQGGVGFDNWMAQRAKNDSGQYLQTAPNKYTSTTPVAGGVVPVAGNVGAGGVYNADGTISDAYFNTADQSFNVLQPGGLASKTAGEQGWFDTAEGGSMFANTAAGVGNLMGAYAAWQGIGAAKDTLNFQKRQYADQKRAYDDSQARKAGLAERFQSLGK